MFLFIWIGKKQLGFLEQIITVKKVWPFANFDLVYQTRWKQNIQQNFHKRVLWDLKNTLSDHI